MAWDVNFGHYVDASLAGVGHDFADVVLSVVAAVFTAAVEVLLGQLQVGVVLTFSIAHADGVLVVRNAPGAALGQQGIFLDFYAPALVVGQVPVELVDFVERQHVEQLHDLLLGEEVARAVQFHASPLEARRVQNLAAGQLHQPFAQCFGQHLAQRADAADDALVVGTGERDELGRDVEHVAAGCHLVGEGEMDGSAAFLQSRLVAGGLHQYVREVFGSRAQRGALGADGCFLADEE